MITNILLSVYLIRYFIQHKLPNNDLEKIFDFIKEYWNNLIFPVLFLEINLFLSKSLPGKASTKQNILNTLQNLDFHIINFSILLDPLFNICMCVLLLILGIICEYDKLHYLYIYIYI